MFERAGRLGFPLSLPGAAGRASDVVAVRFDQLTDVLATLTGTVAHQSARSAAELAVHRLRGVKGVANSIIVAPDVSAGDVKAKIEEALARSAAIDAGRITVTVRDRVVVLTGTVRSVAERDDAERAARAALGVARVDDRLTVAR